MSVLRVPRVFLRGGARWNPNTTNNNDEFATYDFLNADLNWSYLGSQGITPDNYRATFPSWVLTPQLYPPGGGDDSYHLPPAEWNFFGGNDWVLRAPGRPTTVCGGQLANGTSLADDPLFGALADLVGDPFPGSTTPSAGRLVDVNPDAFWSSTYRVRTFRLGDPNDPARYLSGDLEYGIVPSTRWIALARNTSEDIDLAGVAGVVVQLCLPNARLRVDGGASPLLAALDEARHRSGAIGLMVRLSIYLTTYFSGPEFEGCQTLEQKYARLVWTWNAQLAAGQPPLQNPAVSRVVGTVGLWLDGEMQTAPGGRFLVPVAREPTTATPIGLALAEVDPGAGVLTLDMGSTVPEVDANGTKADVGPIAVVLESSGSSLVLGTIGPSQYARTAYEASAGIVDLPLPPGVTPDQVAAGTLALRVGSTVVVAETGLTPSALRVETDERANYVDQGGAGTIALRVLQKGAPPTQSVNVLIQEYRPDPPPPQANTDGWALPDASQRVLRFDNLPSSQVLGVEPSSGGVATLTFHVLRPGFPIVVFFPWIDGDPVPVPPTSIGPFGPGCGPPGAGQILNVGTAFYTTVRAMPFDDALPQQFVELWNKTHDPQQAWQFLYGKVLFLYDMIYPVMRHYAHLDLSDRDVVDQAIGWLVETTDIRMRDSSAYMPVTRDLSAGKRAVIQLYRELVASGWKLERLDPP